jgi:hypothetical protein
VSRKTIPLIHDEAAEQALVGAALVDDGVLNAVAPIVDSRDFYLPAHSAIWQAMVSAHAAGADVDSVTVAAELRAMGRFDASGGASYLDACIDAVPPASHPEDHARRVAALARRRTVCEEARLAFAAANDPAADDEAINGHLEAMRRGWECGGDELPSMTAEEIDALVFPERSGWLVRDWWLAEACGFLGAHEKSSKTVLAFGIALSIANGQPWLGKWDVVRGPVVFVAEEDHPRRVQRRLRKIGKALGLDHTTRDLHVAAQSGCRLTTAKGRGRLAALVRRVRPVLTVIDPLRRVTPGLDEKDSQAMSEILGWLRELQVECKTAIMVLHHLRKEAQGDTGADRSRMSHRLRGTGDLPAWMDSMISISRKDDVTHVCEAEHRDAARLGKTTVRVMWNDLLDTLTIDTQEPGQAAPVERPPVHDYTEPRQQETVF